MVLRKIAFFVAVAVTCACSSAVAQAPASPSASPSPAPSSGPPEYACEDQWSQSADGQWTLACKTGFCGAGGTGEKCEPTGKTKAGKPTCECKKPAPQPPAPPVKPDPSDMLVPCPKRAQCGGECVAAHNGAHGVCKYGLLKQCLCSAGVLGGGVSIPVPKPSAISTIFGSGK